MPMITGVAVGAGVVSLGGAVAAQATDPQSPGTTVTIVGAVAVVLVAVIGVIGNYLSNRRTSPSPPGANIDTAGVHDRLTVIEQIIHELRADISTLARHDDSIDAKVLPLAAVTDSKFADVYRRLDRLEGPQ